MTFWKVARPKGLERRTPGLEGCVRVTEALCFQDVARTATRMCHAVHLRRVIANDGEPGECRRRFVD